MDKIAKIEEAFAFLAGSIASLGTQVSEALREQQEELMDANAKHANLKQSVKQAAQRIIDSL